MTVLAGPMDSVLDALKAATGNSGEGEAASPKIPGEDPVSTTADEYGYDGVFDRDTASNEAVIVTTGEEILENAQILYWDGTAIQNSDHASLVVRDSYVRGETSAETAPVAGNPGNLLIAGDIRTTLGTGNSQSIYINSTIVSRNWAALSTDEAEPALEEGEKELSLYAYGSEVITQDGGYGAYSDLFCSLYSYGSHIQAAETGIISGTYGKVVIGTAKDAEEDSTLAAVLTDADKAKRQNKSQGSIIEGGRNALMIHSVSLPPYWEYEGYSQDELPLFSTPVYAKDSELKTTMSLDKGVEYEPPQAAYIRHGTGSVILIKSTNVEMILDHCSLTPDPKGTGYLIQTVYNNDSMFMNAVPDGATYPGINVTMNNMDVRGDIAHEDYQRDFTLTVQDTVITGAMNEYDCEEWKRAAAMEGFSDYAPDDAYNTHHGLKVILTNQSVWNVTADSHLTMLAVGEFSRVNGDIYVNGQLQENRANNIYTGDVLVTPASQSQPQPQPPAPQPETTTQAQVVDPGFEPDPEAGKGPDEEHVHNWVRADGGYPADCIHDGYKFYYCTTCGAEYTEVLPALAPYEGHSYYLGHTIDPTCYSDGEYLYICDRCGEYYTEVIPSTGHAWSFYYHSDPTCSDYGYDVYICDICGYTEAFDFDYYPPTYTHNYAIVYPTPWQPSLTHTWECTECGATYEEYHDGNYICYCGWEGAVG